MERVTVTSGARFSAPVLVLERSRVSVTVRDIARAAGVSVATVSRALRDLPSVSPETRDLIRSTARRLNYVEMPAAATLATGRTHLVGLITPFIARWSFAQMLAGIEEHLRAVDLDILVHQVGDPSEPEHRRPHVRLRRRVDGFITISLAADSPDLRAILALGKPTTTIGARVPGVSGVYIDDRGAAARATRHLADLGHRDIGLIYGRETSNPLALEYDRVLGFHDVVEAAGLRTSTDWAAPGGFTVAGGRLAMERLLGLPRRPTAVFAFSDEMALGALSALRERRLTPGVDMSVVGFDGHDLAAASDLTTISQPLKTLGTLAAEAVCAHIASPQARTGAHMLPTRLVVRGSTGPIRHQPEQEDTP